MKILKSLPLALFLFAALALVAGEGCTRRATDKGSVKQRLFKPRASVQTKVAGRKVAQNDPDWMVSQANFYFVNDPQGEVDSSVQIYKGIEGVTVIVSYPKTPGVECAMGDDKGTEDEGGRIVFKAEGAQEIFCRNVSLEPIAELEAQYLIAKSKFSFEDIKIGPYHDQLLAAKKELTEGKFNGRLAQSLASFNLLTETQLKVKANSATPTELKFTAKPGDYVQFSVAGGKVARNKKEAKRFLMTAAGLDEKNAQKYFSKPSQKKELPFPEENPYALVCTDQPAGGAARIVSVGGSRFETTQATKISCIVNGPKKLAKHAFGELGIRILVGDTKGVSERIDMTLNNQANMLANAEKQQDDSNFATITTFLYSFTQLSYAAKDDYNRLVAQRKADAEAAEARRVADADKNAKDLSGKKADQILNVILDPTGNPIKAKPMTPERLALLEEMEKRADSALQKRDAEIYKNPRMLNETFYEKYFLFSMQMRPFKSDGATSYIDFVISDTQSVYLSDQNDPYYTPVDPFAPYALIPSNGFYVESRIPVEERRKKQVVVCAKDLPKLTDVVKSFNHLVEEGKDAASPEQILAEINKVKAAEGTVCAATDAAPKQIPTYKRLQTYRFCYQEKEQEGYNGRSHYKEWVYVPTHVEVFFKSAALKKVKSVKLESGDHPFFATKVKTGAGIAGAKDGACVETDEFMPTINPDGRIVGGKVVKPTDPVSQTAYTGEAKPAEAPAPAPSGLPSMQLADPWGDESGAAASGN